MGIRYGKHYRNCSVFVRKYKGMYTVEYGSPAVGLTLLATWDKKQAEAEYARLAQMSEQELQAHIAVQDKKEETK